MTNLQFRPQTAAELIEQAKDELTHFEETVIMGDPAMRGQTPTGLVPLQLVYRREQARQLLQQILELELDPAEIEYYGAEFEKNLCPSTGLESESGILYNKRTGVSIGVMMDWVCEWSCGKPQWQGRYEPKLETCQPQYFFSHFREQDIEDLK